jgi:hypothetical protein
MALILVLLALLGVFAAWGTSSSRSESGSAQAETIPAASVPAVTGIYPRYAKRQLRAAGLVPVERWCRTRAVEWAVERQSIAAGTVVPRGTRVRLFLVPALGSGVKHPPCNSFAAISP